MKKVLFGLLAFLTTASAYAVVVHDTRSLCVDALVRYPRFEFGQVTHANETAEDFFSSPVTADGRRRFVLTVGIAGSGKSTWTRHADAYDWEVVSIDAIRGEVVRKAGLDPADVTNHFRPEILAAAHFALQEKLDLLWSSSKSIVLDQNNATPLRAHWMQQARAQRFHVEGLLFFSKDAATHIANVRHRGAAGNLVADTVIESRFEQFRFFNTQARTGVPNDLGSPPIVDIAPFVALTRTYPDLATALSSLSGAEKADLEKQLDADTFDSIRIVWTPNVTQLPHDSPVLRKVTRLYAAITNRCNRACPWCCVYSSPAKSTFLSPSQLAAHFPAQESFDLQLEGGEATIHPQLFEFVRLFWSRPNAHYLVLITNGVKLPRTEKEMVEYLRRFGKPFTIKLSINHYLLDKDPHLMEKAQLLRKAVASLGQGYQVIYNVRLRRGAQYGDDRAVLQAVQAAGLADVSNVFFLQSYGLASNQADWDPPFTVSSGFKLINPDGSAHTGTLEDRADAMGKLK